MEYKLLQHTTKQHTIPQCYLKNFSKDRAKIFQKSKTAYVDEETVVKELRKPISIKDKATIIDDFYTVKNGREPMLVESLVYANSIEFNYTKIYNLLINREVQGFNMQERMQLLMCLLSLHCRTSKQFNIFFVYIKSIVNNQSELDKIKEDYKGFHIKEILPNFIAAHEFKVVKVAFITDTSEFLTSDNPVLIVDSQGILKNSQYEEQFNIDNDIIIPLDSKHCCILSNATDKNGISIENKLFYNKISRIEVDCSFVQSVNYLMIRSADKVCFGSEEYLRAFFSVYKLV